MWLFSKQGFCSAVQFRGRDDVMMLRFRCKGDAYEFERLAHKRGGFDPVAWNVETEARNHEFFRDLEYLPGSRIWETSMVDLADYRFRFLLTRPDFVALLATLAEEVTYGNFKTAAGAGDKARGMDDVEKTVRENMRHEVWATMSKFQDDAEYNDTRRARGLTI